MTDEELVKEANATWRILGRPVTMEYKTWYRRQKILSKHLSDLLQEADRRGITLGLGGRS
jgi:hypothetical protein